MYTIRLENTVTHQIYEQQVEDTNNGGKLYYNFSLSTVDMADGEYILTVFGENGDVLAEDLLRIGDFNPQTLQYTKGENTFISVELAAKLENKQVYIDNIETTVYPNNGYDGMTDVHINAQPLYDSARSEGYGEGYGVGQSEGYPNGFADGYDKGSEDGYNTGSAEAYPKGYEDGYGNGKTEGYNEGYGVGYGEGDAQGYENGKKDGYDQGYAEGEKVSYGEGYDQGQKDIAENARVLEVTENGFYLSKFSEIPKPDFVTGVYPDGTEFYNYTVLEGKIFDTKILATSASTLEIWYKGDGIKVGDAYNVIIGAGKNDDSSCYQIRYEVDSNETVRYQVGYSSRAYTWDEDVWHHIVIKYKEGSSLLYLWVDDVQVVSFGNITFNPQSTFYINGVEYDTSRNRTANGSFGMIKIDDVVIIPTKDGFLNTNTGELLDVIQGGGYEFVNNTVIPEGEMYKTVKVNVAQSVKFSRYGMKCAYSTFQYLPNWIDLNNMVDCSYLFSDSKIIEAPYFDTSNTTTMNRMFSNCFDLTTIPIYDTKKVTDFSGMFNNASALETIPAFEIGSGANIKELVYNCRNLISFPAIDTSGAVNMQSMFYGCTSLTEIPALDASSIDVGAYNSASIFGYNELPKLTKAGGLLNLRRKIDDTYGWSKCPNLDRESCINILNGLYHFVGNGETPNSNEGKLKVHQNFLNAVGDDITIGTNKGWTITT